MAKKETNPVISKQDMTKLLLSTYGARQYLTYLNRQLDKAATQMDNYIESQNPLAAAKCLAQIREVSHTMNLILTDGDSANEIDKI